MKQSQIIISKRRENIMEHIRKNGKSRVEELSALCNVSSLTIRRDLDALERSNLVIRYFGGAELAGKEMQLVRFEEKAIANQLEKEQIAAEARKYIKDGATVFMNSGTTVLQILKNLQSRNVTIITNNALAYQFADKIHGVIISTGGMYTSLTKAYIGDFATDIVDKIYADICILGVNGISAANGVTTSVLQETIINKKMAERKTGKVIVVADGSKVGKTFSFVSLETSQVDILITDVTADPLEVEKLRGLGVEVCITNTAQK